MNFVYHVDFGRFSYLEYNRNLLGYNLGPEYGTGMYQPLSELLAFSIAKLWRLGNNNLRVELHDNRLEELDQHREFFRGRQLRNHAKSNPVKKIV